MFKKIIWALLELATIGSGTYIFVSTMVDESGVNEEEAGLGAFLIVLGLLFRNWRTTLFIKEEKGNADKTMKSESQNKSVNTMLIVILALALFIINKKINDTTLTADSNESQIHDLDSRMSEFDDIEYRLDNVESFEERIENLENYSHSHYY